MSDLPFRVQPALDDENRSFWTSGEQGELHLACCDSCGYWIHPRSPRCPTCGGSAITPRAVSGRGQVWSFTINHHSWDGSTEPYAIGLVELDEQPGLRLTTNLVGCTNEEIHIGMRVRVTFEQQGVVWFPLFEPDSGSPGSGDAGGDP